MIDKVSREPIEQFGMSWGLSLPAEVFRSAYQPTTKEISPYAIHGHA